MYKLFLTLRYLRSRRIAYFAIAAVTLCVAMVLIVMSVMGGWLDQVMVRARGLLGDVIVDNRTYGGFPLYQEFIDEVSSWPEVAKATPVVYSYGLISFPNTEQTGTVSVVGIRLEDVYDVNAFKQSLYYEPFYPGTTTLAPQQRPLLGFDDEHPLKLDDDEFGALRRPVLPEPYASALAKARDAYTKRTGKVLDDPDSTDGILNELLRKAGQPIIPGRFDVSEEVLANGQWTQSPTLEGDALPGIIIGRDIIAQRLSDGRYERYVYTKGTRVLLTVMAASISGTIDPIPRKNAFRYADDSRTGIYQIDSEHVYVDFDLLQKLLDMDEADRVDDEGNVIGKSYARCSQIQMKLAKELPPAELHALCQRLEDKYHSFLGDKRFNLSMQDRHLLDTIQVLTWQESQAHLIGPVQKERMLVTILFGIISLVAVALILCILYMIVLQKTRDIGIVKSIGGSSTGVAMIFVFYGAAVGIVGAVLGSTLGTLFVTNINEIQDFLISINPAWRVWDMKVYSFDRIPSEVAMSDVISVVVIAIAASTIGSLAAAWRAGAMHPVEALRYE